jgi:two-component system, NarL family, invasion response regulator UvrY
VRILIVDDHAILRAGLKRILEDEFADVVVGEAGTADHAVRELGGGAWDVVLLDISLPGRSGLDLLPDIKRDHPATRVIVLSSFGDQQFAVRSLRVGASAFLTKERAARELIDAIRTVVAGRRYVSAELAEQLAALVAADKPQSPHETLSSREFEVFRLIACARSVSEIGVELGLSVKTVSTYRARVLEKMGMSSNAELMQYAIRHGLVS